MYDEPMCFSQSNNKKKSCDQTQTIRFEKCNYKWNESHI